MTKDRIDIGLTPEAQEHLRRIEDTGWFADGQDIARFCLAHAVRQGVEAGDTSGVETRWSSGNFDPTGEIRAVLSAIYPASDTPVRLMQHLVNRGLVMLGEGLGAAEMSLEDLLEVSLGS